MGCMMKLIYQNYRYYCVDGKTKKEISEIIHVPEDFIELMVQYYESNMR